MASLSEEKLNKNHSENRNNEHLRRNRPRQEIYVPGSGPLKKSNNFERCDEQQQQPMRDSKDQMRTRDRERDRYQDNRGREHDRDYNRYSECDRSHSRDFRKSNSNKPKTSDQDFSSGSNYRKNPKMNYRHDNYAQQSTGNMGTQGVTGTAAATVSVPAVSASDNKQWSYDRHHNNNNNNVRVPSNYSNRNKPNEYVGKFVRRTNSSSYSDKNRFSVNLPPRLRKYNQNHQSSGSSAVMMPPPPPPPPTTSSSSSSLGEKNHSNFSSHSQNDYFFQKKQPHQSQHQQQQLSSFKNNEFCDSSEMKSIPKSSEKHLADIESKLEHLNVINCHDVESSNRVQPIIVDNVDNLPDVISEDPVGEYSDCEPNKNDDSPEIENGDSNSFDNWNDLIENEESAKNNSASSSDGNCVVKTQMETKHCETTMHRLSPIVVENTNTKRVQETNERIVTVSATATAPDQSDNWREQNRRNEELRRNSDLKVKSNEPGIIIMPQHDNYHQSDYKSDKRKMNVRHFENSSSNHRNNINNKTQSNRSRDINLQSVNLCMSELSNYKNPNWYDETSSAFRNCKNPKVISEVMNIDLKLNWILTNGHLINEWQNLLVLRESLKSKLQFFLLEDLKFSQVENIESHFWKLLYYNVIEFLRKSLVTLQSNPEEKSILKSYALNFIDDGLKFFKSLIAILEEKYEFRLKEILETDLCLRKKATGFTGLALNSVQKLCLFLGDLTRYNEQINETLQIFKSKQ